MGLKKYYNLKVTTLEPKAYISYKIKNRDNRLLLLHKKTPLQIAGREFKNYKNGNEKIINSSFLRLLQIALNQYQLKGVSVALLSQKEGLS